MSLLDKAKELLHIGEPKVEDAKESEASVEEPQAETQPAPAPVEASEVQPVNTDYWVKKIQSELYKVGVANTVTAEPFEAGLPFIRISVPEHHAEQAEKVALEVFVIPEYFKVSAR